MRKITPLILIAFAALLVAGELFLRSIYMPPILTYHSIDAKTNDEYKLVIVNPEIFKKQMEFLKKNGYAVISLSALADLINSKKPIPHKTVCITFDDGYENNYTNAYPVLKGLGFPATIFIISNFINLPTYLTTGEIKEMSDDGIEIGSHTKAHYWLGKTAAGADLKLAKKEIAESKKALEDITGKKVDLFCYPGGGFTKDTRQLVIDAGYKAAAATSPGRNYPKEDLFALKRIRIGRQCNNMFVFWFETSGYYTWFKELHHRH